MRYLVRCIPFILFIFLLSCDYTPTDPTADTIAPILWQGAHKGPPTSPEQNWVYFDIDSLATYIWSGTTWDTMTISGVNGMSIQWLGSLPAGPPTPVKNQAFFNTKDQVSYVFNGVTWDTLSCSGENGFSFEWKGTLPSHPANPKRLWAYYNSSDLTLYQYNGAQWEALTIEGLNGTEIVWRGALDGDPIDPEEKWAYYNTILGASLIYTNGEWQLLSKDGLQGKTGNAVIWLGEQSIAPPKPSKYMAYYNPQKKISYIYNGIGWDIFVTSGRDGLSIVWWGSLTKEPEYPVKNWAYYNTDDKCSYLFDGLKWVILCKDGKSGLNGVSILWQGTASKHHPYPKKNWAYYNRVEGITYLYNGVEWIIICVNGQDGVDGIDGEDGENGEDGDTTLYSVADQVGPNCTLSLKHNQNSDHLSFIGQYKYDDETVYNWYTKSPKWGKPFEEKKSTVLYTATTYNQKFDLFKRNDGSLLYAFIETEPLYQGGKYASLSTDGALGEIKTFTNANITNLSIHEDKDNNLLFTYIHNDDSLKSYCTIVSPDGTQKEIVLYNDTSYNLSTYLRANGNIFITFLGKDSILSFAELDNEFTFDTLYKHGSAFTPSTYTDIKLLESKNQQMICHFVDLILIVQDDHTFVSKKINETRIYNSSQPQQDDEGNLYFMISMSKGSGIGTYSETKILKLTESGEIIRSKTFRDAIIGDLKILKNGTISCIFRTSHRTFKNGGFVTYYNNTHLYTLDKDFNCLSDYNLNKKLDDEVIVETDDNELAIVSGIFEPYKTNNDITFTSFQRADTIPGLSLEVLSENEACIINHTGFSLYIKLGIILGREVNNVL